MRHQPSPSNGAGTVAHAHMQVQVGAPNHSCSCTIQAGGAVPQRPPTGGRSRASACASRRARRTRRLVKRIATAERSGESWEGMSCRFHAQLSLMHSQNHQTHLQKSFLTRVVRQVGISIACVGPVALMICTTCSLGSVNTWNVQTWLRRVHAHDTVAKAREHALPATSMKGMRDARGSICSMKTSHCASMPLSTRNALKPQRTCRDGATLNIILHEVPCDVHTSE